MTSQFHPACFFLDSTMVQLNLAVVAEKRKGKRRHQKKRSSDGPSKSQYTFTKQLICQVFSLVYILRFLSALKTQWVRFKMFSLWPFRELSDVTTIFYKVDYYPCFINLTLQGYIISYDGGNCQKICLFTSANPLKRL